MKKHVFFFGLILVGLFFASCAFHSQEYYFGTYAEAEKLYEKGKYGKAVEKYQQYLTENPQGNMAAIAEYYTAKCYVELGKRDEAREAFQKVVQGYPGSSWADFSVKQIEKLDAVAGA